MTKGHLPFSSQDSQTLLSVPKGSLKCSVLDFGPLHFTIHHLGLRIRSTSPK
jgi:hypothetical protein